MLQTAVRETQSTNEIIQGEGNVLRFVMILEV